MAPLTQYNYLLGIGSCFCFLEAFNNGANDVANAWATSVSSRSVNYKTAMVLSMIFEMLGALTVGARSAEAIKNGIISPRVFRGNAGVQMLSFTVASGAAASFVMWCTRHSVHVSSTYSLISSIAGVGVGMGGASQVQWGWHGGKGLGAIFAGLFMAPAASACFGAIIYSLIKYLVLKSPNSVARAVWTSPLFFFIAGTVSTLSIVYKGSPKLGLNKKPAWFIAAITLGAGLCLCLLSALFFLPYLHSKVIKRDASVKWWMFIYGPALFSREVPEGEARYVVPRYGPVRERKADSTSTEAKVDTTVEVEAVDADVQPTKTYQELMVEGRERLHAELRKQDGALGWAMRTLHKNPMGPGQIYELGNIKICFKRLIPMIVVGLLYGINYDIHTVQAGMDGTPDGKRMKDVYAAATEYPDEVEHAYSFIQVITACTASFAHGANDVGNAVSPWAVIFQAWRTGDPAASKLPVDIWQIAVMVLWLNLGLCLYGYMIMTVMGNKITYHSPARGCSMEMGAAITTLLFSQQGLPVSTSMCITGATVGVGLCNGNYKAINWQRVGLLLFSWIMTIPVAGSLSGVSMAIVLNAPHFDSRE